MAANNMNVNMNGNNMPPMPPGPPAAAQANQQCFHIANMGVHGLHLGFERDGAYRHVRTASPDGRCRQDYFRVVETVPVGLEHCAHIPRGPALCRAAALPVGGRRARKSRRRANRRARKSRRSNRS